MLFHRLPVAIDSRRTSLEYWLRSREARSLEGDSVKRTERRAFIFLVVFLGPILAVAIVGGYGFAVWMSQLLFGLPGG